MVVDFISYYTGICGIRDLSGETDSYHPSNASNHENLAHAHAMDLSTLCSATNSSFALVNSLAQKLNAFLLQNF